MATESETKEPSSESLQDTVHIPFDGDAIAMNGSSISHEIAKDETLHPIAVRLLNSSKGEVLVESPIDIQHLTSNRNNTAVMNEKLSTAQAESMEDELQGETDIKKLEKANEDKQIKVQAEAGILNDKSTDEIDSISDAGPSELEIVKDPPEIMISDLEPAANEPQSDKIESPANEAPEEPETNRLERRNEDKAVEPSEKGNTQEPLDEMSKGNLEPAKYEQALDAVPEEMEARKLERVTEDNNVKIDETGICNNEIAKNADGISVLEASDNENRQESLEITPNKDLEPAEDEVGNGKLESSLDAVPEDPKEKNLERVNEDEIGKREAETGFCDDERSDDADRIPVGKPSQKESRQEPLELDVSEQNKLESSLDVVPEEPEEKKLESVNEHKNVIIEAKTGNADIERIDDAESVSEAGPSENENKQEPLQIIAKEDFGATEDAPAHETETTRKEESFVNLEEFSPKDEKKYEPIEKASVMMPEPQNAEISNLIKETEGASENTSTNEVIKETIHEESYKNEGTNNSACEELDQNDRNTDTTIDEYRNYTEAVNEKKERSSENQVIEDTVHEGAEVDKDATNSISKELSESIDNDVNVIKKETALDSESTSQTNSQENIHDVIFNSEAAGTDISTILEGQSMDKAIDGLSTSCDTQKCNIGATTDGQEAKEQISPAANENESSERNIVAHDESIIEKDVDEKTEKKKMQLMEL
ncbi:neurofilament heavy polypeptide-like [Asparagus officinalis]|nr:neurofilament heavy polypeptide-like [Asparagus officinalis]